MEMEEGNRKMKMVKSGKTSEDKEASAADDENMAIIGEEDGDSIMVSEEMQLEIARIHEKIERFTQLVSELLESGKSMLKELSNQFEEKIILIHKEQMDKWQEEIKDLRLIDASNQEAFVVLENAKSLFHNINNGS